MTIEKLAQHTLEPLAQLMMELWPDSAYLEELQDNAEIVHANDKVCYLARIEEQYVAFIIVSIETNYSEDINLPFIGYLEGLHVKREYRQHGVAGMLLQKGEQWARELGCREMISHAESTNIARVVIYKSLGFMEANTTNYFIKIL